MASSARLTPNSKRSAPRAPKEGLEFPKDDVELARNNRPVVLLHGTLVEKDGIEAYRDFALASGHPVSHKTYQSITKGGRIEKSTELASQEVNLSRAEVARKNLENLKDLDRAGLQTAFQLNSELYGQSDPSVALTLDRLPAVLSSVDELLSQDEGAISDKLSGQLLRLEADFAKQLAEAGVEGKKASGIADEVLDTVAPKAILIGHSAGGFVAQNMVVNPELTPDDDEFTYDGGTGIAEALIISSPIEKGLNKPSPPGIAELPFYRYDKNVLQPLEKLPPASIALMNPFISAAYHTNKSLLKSLSAASFMLTASLTGPLTYTLRPGNEQVEEGSEFFKNRVQDKPIPEGVSVITFTSPLDRLVLEDRAALETDESNGHSFSVDLGVTDEDLIRERPTWTHVLMAERPNEFEQQFNDAVNTDEGRLVRLLDSANDEGVRHRALSMLQEETKILNSPNVQGALEKVAAERLPFEDSASFLAYQLLGSQ